MSVPVHTGHPPNRLAVDIADRADIEALLTAFYGRAFRDELLGPVFVDIAHMDLAAHLPVMCDFWETVLFRTGSYRRNALHPHQRLAALVALSPAHFARWLSIWRATIDESYAGDKAEQAKVQATRIATAMSRRITGCPLDVSIPARSGRQQRAERDQSEAEQPDRGAQRGGGASAATHSAG